MESASGTVLSVPFTKSGRQTDTKHAKTAGDNVTPRFCGSGTIRGHTLAPEDAAPFGPAPPPSRKQVLRQARVT